MEQKYVVVPFERGGFARLCFTKANDQWVCKLENQSMYDLQALLEGKELREYVEPWRDNNNGIN